MHVCMWPYHAAANIKTSPCCCCTCGKHHWPLKAPPSPFPSLPPVAQGGVSPFTHGMPLAAPNTGAAAAAAAAQAAAQGMGSSALDAAAAAMLAQTNAFLAGDMDELGGSETPAAAARESRRRNRGGRLGEFIKAEEEAGEGTSSAGAGRGGRRRDRDCDEEPADSYDSTQSPSKRGRTNTANTGCDSDGGRSLAVTADMDDATKTRIRREKNRVAARKCRQKKMQFMQDLQRTLRELMRKNEEYRLQVSRGLGEGDGCGQRALGGSKGAWGEFYWIAGPSQGLAATIQVDISVTPQHRHLAATLQRYASVRYAVCCGCESGSLLCCCMYCLVTMILSVNHHGCRHNPVKHVCPSCSCCLPALRSSPGTRCSAVRCGCVKP